MIRAMQPPSTVEVLDVQHSKEIDGIAQGNVTPRSDNQYLILQGWVIGSLSPITEIEIVDRVERVITRAPVSMPRPDLAKAFPDASAIATAGFRVVLEAQGKGADNLSIRPVSGHSPPPRLASVELRIKAPESHRRPILASSGRIFGRGQVSWSIDTPDLHWSILSLSGEGERVLTGRDGWLFLRNDTNDTLGQHTGSVQFGRRERREWRRLLERRRGHVEKLGVVWLFIVAPDKESLYPEHLPRSIALSTRRPIDDFLELAEQAKAPVIYALPCLEEKKSEGALYSKVDTHWNHRGAYVTYRMICDELLRKGVTIRVVGDESLTWLEESGPGDLGSKMYPGPVVEPISSARVNEQRAELVLDNGVTNHGRVWVFERADFNGAACVVFGESFVENMLMFLQETFSRLVVVHTSMFVPEIIEREHPDVVLSLPVERFLIRVPDDKGAFEKLGLLAERKGGELPWKH